VPEGGGFGEKLPISAKQIRLCFRVTGAE